MKTITVLGPKIIQAFRKKNQRRIRKLNDEVLKKTAMDFNAPNFNLAVYSYVLSKIVSKPRFLKPRYREWLKNIESDFQKIIEASKNKGEEGRILGLFSVLKDTIGKLEEEDPRFLIGLVEKGKLKMAATLYAQGISLGVATSTTGLDKQEILNYAGETMMYDRLKQEKSITERMKIARKFISE